MTIFCGISTARAVEPFKITPDVVYGHKAGMALTFDVVQPTHNRKGVGVLYIRRGARFRPGA